MKKKTEEIRITQSGDDETKTIAVLATLASDGDQATIKLDAVGYNSAGSAPYYANGLNRHFLAVRRSGTVVIASIWLQGDALGEGVPWPMSVAIDGDDVILKADYDDAGPYTVTYDVAWSVQQT